jgi:hypothetical protein
MTYPTLAEVETANRFQICNWVRNLPSPGLEAVGQDNFLEVLLQQVPVMDRICERFRELDGMTPEISKAIGW